MKLFRNPLLLLIYLSITCQMIKSVDDFKDAINDAKNAYPSEVRTLSPIVPSNKNTRWRNGKVLVASIIPEWAANQFYFPAYKADGSFTSPTVPGVFMWVTAVPQLRNFISRYIDKRNVTTDPRVITRVQKLLGLPVRSGNFYVAQFWIDPKYLFRPCPDAEIDDMVCEADTIKGQPNFDVFRKINASQKHREWYNNEKANKYTGSYPFPWTRLGYTYDYYKKYRANDSMGLSEYVIRQGSPMIIESIIPFNSYK